jgi:hypothetical protein
VAVTAAGVVIKAAVSAAVTKRKQARQAKTSQSAFDRALAFCLEGFSSENAGSFCEWNLSLLTASPLAAGR